MVALQAHSAWGQRQAGKLPVGPASSMLPWKPVALPVNPSLGQAGSQTSLSSILIPTAFWAMISFVGFRLGRLDHGVPSVLGYVAGGLAGAVALRNILKALGIVTDAPASTVYPIS